MIYLLTFELLLTENVVDLQLWNMDGHISDLPLSIHGIFQHLLQVYKNKR